MIDINSFKTRQDFIVNSNDLNKKTNIDLFAEGNKRKVELDRKLEDDSIRGNMLLSGNIVRQNILNSSASKMTTINNIVDADSYTEENNELYDKFYYNLNKGKEIANNIKKNVNKENKSKNQLKKDDKNI